MLSSIRKFFMFNGTGLYSQSSPAVGLLARHCSLIRLYLFTSKRVVSCKHRFKSCVFFRVFLHMPRSAIRLHHCAHVCCSETDDSSSLPVAERSEVSPGARKLSIHLTLPDFQDASTGLISHCSNSSKGIQS